MTEQVLTDDAKDLLAELVAAGVDFLVVGGHALAVHGVSRATADLDVWVLPRPDNASRLIDALRQFGAPLAAHGVSARDFERRGTVYQMGLPPNRIDVITAIDGVEFDAAHAGRVVVVVDGVPIPFIGRADLILNTLAAGRLKDLADVEALRGAEDAEG